MKFILNNNQIVETDVAESTATLDFLRRKGIRGVKEGCHEGDCGACMVLMGDLDGGELTYKAVTSCLLPIGDIDGKHIVTIEGLNYEDKLNLIQNEIVKEGGSQCGFCTPGFIISLTAFFLNGELKKENIMTAIEGNICRCTGYASIIRASETIFNHLSSLKDKKTEERIPLLIKKEVIPAYFSKIKEQLSVLNRNQKGLEKKEGTYVAGGTDLFVQNKELEDPLFLSRLDEDLRKIWEDDGYIYIGAVANAETIRNSRVLNEILPVKEDLKRFAVLSIRNRATIGGNIVNASPIGDLTIYFLALDPDICLSSEEGKRILKLKDFFKDYKVLDLKTAEIVQWIRIKKEKRLFNFEKVAKRHRMDIASVNSAITLKLEKGRIVNPHISAGGVGCIPIYLSKTVEFLEGKEVTTEVIHEAVGIANTEISPIDDVRGSAEYKRLLLRQLLLAHFIELFPEMEERL